MDAVSAISITSSKAARRSAWFRNSEDILSRCTYRCWQCSGTLLFAKAFFPDLTKLVVNSSMIPICSACWSWETGLQPAFTAAESRSTQKRLAMCSKNETKRRWGGRAELFSRLPGGEKPLVPPFVSCVLGCVSGREENAPLLFFSLSFSFLRVHAQKEHIFTGWLLAENSAKNDEGRWNKHTRQ